jgi:hypothetical protein
VDEPGAVSGLLVECDPASEESVARAIRRLRFGSDAAGEARLRPRVTTRADLQLLVPRDILHTEGAYHALFALAFATGVPLVLVTSGVGLSTRRRETGLLRATGWRIDEVLLRGLTESVSVALAGGALAVVLAWCWLELANGFGVAAVFIHGTPAAPGFDLPYRLTPLPVTLGFAFALLLVLAGTISATWRAASTDPAEAMK